VARRPLRQGQSVNGQEQQQPAAGGQRNQTGGKRLGGIADGQAKQHARRVDDHGQQRQRRHQPDPQR